MGRTADGFLVVWECAWIGFPHWGVTVVDFKEYPTGELAQYSQLLARMDYRSL